MSRLSKRQYSRDKIGRWFNAALDRSDPKPSSAVLDKLARALQVELNRADNVELGRLGVTSLLKLRDVSPKAVLEEKAGRISRLAKQMLVEIDDLEGFSGGYIWRHPSRDIYLDEVRQLATELAFFAHASKESTGAQRGQPPVPWKSAARQFCLLVKKTMEDLGYRRRLSLTNPESVPTIVGAAAMQWAYGRRVSPEGFVSAMRDRNRTKKK